MPPDPPYKGRLRGYRLRRCALRAPSFSNPRSATAFPRKNELPQVGDQTNKQGKATQHIQGSHFSYIEKMSCKAKQHSTPKAVTFPRKNELPQVGLEPTTLYTLDRALYQLSYRSSSAGWAQISHLIVHLMNRLTINSV